MTSIGNYGFSRHHRRETVDVGFQLPEINQTFPDLGVTGEKIESINVSKLISGTVASQQITLGITRDTAGDVYIGGGTFNAATWTATNGFILGLDDSASNREKFYLGNAVNWIDWNVTTANTLTIAGVLVAGEIHIPDRNTTTNSFHVNTTGNMWIGATETDFNASNNNAEFYVLNTGAMRVGSSTTGALDWNVTTANTLTIRGNTSAQPVLEIVNEATSGITVSQYSANNAASNITFRKARGTLAAPTATLLDDSIGFVAGNGYGATGFPAFGVFRTGITFAAAENWTDAAQGTYMDFSTTGTGGTTRLVRLRINASGLSQFDGQVRINNTAAVIGLNVTSTGNQNALEVTMNGPLARNCLSFNTNSVDGSGLGGDAYAMSSNVTAAGGVAYFFRDFATPIQPILTLDENNSASTATMFSIRVGGSPLFEVGRRGQLTITEGLAESGTPNMVVWTGGAHTTLTASVEATDINFNLARTVQFDTGALTTQRAMRIQGPTYAFVLASTITNAVTLEIGPPIAGTNATITNRVALATTGGRVGIGTISPAMEFDILQAITGTLTGRIRNTNVAAGDHSVWGIDVGDTTAGDPSLLLTVNNGNQWYVGIDNSDSDKFMVGTGTAVGTSTMFTITTGGQVGIGTVSPVTSALLDLTSTTGALMVPRMTTVQKNALTATNGMIVYDSTLNKFQGYEAGAWTSFI